MNYLSKICRTTQPYMAAEQPLDRDYIKLNTNGSPYPPCKGVEESLKSIDTRITLLNIIYYDTFLSKTPCQFTLSNLFSNR